MRIVTWNVRHAAADDGPNSWPFRREKFLRKLRGLDADVIGFQEVLPWHADEIVAAMPGYHRFGEPREPDGEACLILGRLPVDDSGTYWLSETPDVPYSVSWGSACIRAASWIQIGQIKITNLHLDHVSELARQQGVQVALNRASGSQAILLGDFNAEPDSRPIQQVLDAGWTDLVNLPDPTFTGFGHETLCRIDYIFGLGIAPHGLGQVLSETDVPPYSSDHWPVVVEF